jgi:tRNA (cytidine56-2'-O)-methyltransferase
LTTHVALVARAFGARSMLLQPPDPTLAERLESVGRRWGGNFRIRGVDDWKATVREFDGTVVHLTMYGEPFERVVPKLRGSARILLVVGGAKVPAQLYQLAHHNVAVGSQPHSEVAAIAILLDRVLGPPANRAGRGGRQRIVPQVRGKKVVPRRGSP